ncbi:unnamed protein product [Dimorphilus gyrociliatus]|uniref:Uncharacterized protein n=1 Tax=Dimorphilus gyrociliatus TaxID=2664684 RepID=A0A7I8WFE8_9ANNE|nr:unnamed protein product [Dimorphilus gyrociliatus]
MASNTLSDIYNFAKPEYISGLRSSLLFNPFTEMKIEIVKKIIKKKMKDSKTMRIDEWLDEKSEYRNDIFLTMIMTYRLKHEDRKQIMSDLDVVKDIPKLFIYAHETILSSDSKAVFSPLRDILNIVWNGSHCSAKFGRKCYNDGVVKLIVKKLLTNWRFSSTSVSDKTFDLNKKERRRLLVGYLSILNNILRLNDDLRKPIRNLGCVEVICKLKENIINDPKKSSDTACLTILSYLIIHEDEIEMIKMKEENVLYLESNLESSLQSAEHFDTVKGLLSDSLIAINHLAVNDENKILMIRYIPLLSDTVQKALTGDEQELAIRCLKTLILSMNCKKVLKQKKYIIIIKRAAEKGMNSTVKELAKTLLTEIEKQAVMPTKAPPECAQKDPEERLMLKRKQPLTRGFISKKKCSPEENVKKK